MDLHSILLSENIVESINKNLDYLVLCHNLIIT